MWQLIVAYQGKPWARQTGSYDKLIYARDYLWRTSKREILWTALTKVSSARPLY